MEITFYAYVVWVSIRFEDARGLSMRSIEWRSLIIIVLNEGLGIIKAE